MVCHFSLPISICAVMADLGRIMGQLKLNNSLSSVVGQFDSCLWEVE